MFNERTTTRRTRKSMSLDMKMEILNRLEEGHKPTEIAKVYGINESTVRTVSKRKENIRSSVASGTLSSSQCSSYTRNPEVENMEKALMIWMDDNVQKKIPMNSLMIREKAVHIFNKLKNQASSVDKMDKFSASKGWFQNFKKRYSLRHLKFNDKVGSSNKAAGGEFSPIITKIIEENGYVPEQVFNTDEAALFWKKKPDGISVTQNIQSVSSFKINKDRVTLLLCCNALGDHLMKPLLINRAVQPQAMKQTDLNGISIHWVEHKKARITDEIFCNWFHKCFVVEAEKYMKTKGLPFKILLILDNVLCLPRNLEHPNVKILFFSSPNTSALIQPLGQDIIATFKINYITRTLSNIFNKLENDESFTNSEASKRYNILNCVENIALALNDVKHSSQNTCCKVVCPQVVAPDITVPTTKEEISSVITLSKEFEKEGFDKSDLNKSDDDDFEFINFVPETKPNDECNNDYEEIDSFTAENLCKALELAKRLENAIVDIDPSIQRALKFRKNLQKCCSEYQEIYETLVKENIKKKSSKEIYINSENEVELLDISSDTGDEFVPIKQKRLSDTKQCTVT